MPEPGPSNVGVVRWTPSDASPETTDDSPDRMEPASPRHAHHRYGPWQRTVTSAQESLISSAEATAAQVDLVAERMMAALERCRDDRATEWVGAGQPDPTWDLDEVAVSFGVQLAGEATPAVFSTSGESSAQITLTFSRTDDARDRRGPDDVAGDR